jgi:hypothetical protein
MKKLGKLKLNPKKLLNHEELVSFKGGSGTGCGEYVWYVCRRDLEEFWEDCVQNCDGYCAYFVINC